MNEAVKKLLEYLVLPIGIVLACALIYFIGEVWSKAKIIFSDIIKLFGWTHRSVRKLTVKSEYEGTINSIIYDYNRNFEETILPKCKIEWITSASQAHTLKENTAIICLSFDKKDHNLNFFNATFYFVQTAIINKAKSFLRASSKNAIDLLATHIILKNNRKEVLATFNRKYSEFDQDTKREFESLYPTNDKGLFLNLLIPEYHFYGEIINELPPIPEYATEVNRFLEWFKDLANRNFEEITNLKFISKNYKVGVILVARSETWQNFGPSAYTKWADYYASEGYNSVYVLAKGAQGIERSSKVVNILTSTRGFDQTNRNTKIKCYSPEGEEYIVSCFALRPNRATIEYLAWEKFKEFSGSSKEVPAIIDYVEKSGVRVNVFGLKFTIPNELLSEINILDARRIFKVESELFVKIIEFNPENQRVSFSNKGTSSDPKIFIEEVLGKSGTRLFNVSVDSIVTDSQGLQMGIKTYCAELKSIIFIPRSKATKSRFIDLSKKFAKAQVLKILIDDFNPTFGQFVGIIEGLSDPWTNGAISDYKLGDVIVATVKEINEFYLTCEISEGLECRVSYKEISWNEDDCKTADFTVDGEIRGQLIILDKDRKQIYISPRKLTKPPEQVFYESNSQKIIAATVTEIIDVGLVIRYDDSARTGLIPWFEIGWGQIGRLNKLFTIGQSVEPIIYEFDPDKKRIGFSLKRKLIHQFGEWLKVKTNESTVRGVVTRYFDGRLQIELSEFGYKVQAFIHISDISSIVRIDNDDLKYYLPIGETFSFFIESINEEWKTIQVSRISYLSQIVRPEYGDSLQVSYVKETYNKGYFYSDNFEGWIHVPAEHVRLGQKIEVLLAAKATGEFSIVE